MKLLLLPALAVGRTFVDDAGTRHTTDLDKPRIVIGVHDGLSLEHMGVDIAQVIATHGTRCQSGSNLNGGYDNGNLYTADGTLDHNAAGHDPSHFPTDPIDANEAAMIAQSADLTPSCSSQCFWCTGEEGEILAQIDAHWDSIDFIVQGVDSGGQTYLPGDLASEAEARGVPIIVLSPLWETGQYSHSFIEVTQRFEELANFLGATKDLSDDKAALCAEVNKFKATAAAAAERGVRALGTYSPYGPVADGSMTGWLYSPGWSQTLNMFEELGMQLLHSTDPPDSLDAASLPYPVDFWLYDARVTLDFVSDTFAADWPHPAVVAKQYAYFLTNSVVHSYEIATEQLQAVGEALGTANRIEDATACTEVDDVTAARYTWADGEYACPTPVEYDFCAHPSRHFVDDAGTRHSTHKTAPTVVAIVHDALTLQDMGLSHVQVHGTIGQRTSTYSNFGQREGSSAEVYTNSGETEWDPSQFPQDAYTAQEMHMIARAIDMTPSCEGVAATCTGETHEIIEQLDAHGWPDFIVASAYGTHNYFTPELRGNASAHNTKLITMTQGVSWNTYGSDSGSGFIEVANRYEELATFLGATADLSDQKEALCHEVNKFKATAAAAATRGVRALALYAPQGPMQGDNADAMFGYLYDAGKDSVLNMLEELGMQILHTTPTRGEPSPWEFSTTTVADFPYEVDFFLYDSRKTFDFTSEAFAAVWPHPALVAKQYAYWPINGQVHSYEHAVEILHLVGEALGTANKVAGDKSCTAVADVTAPDYRVAGLAGGEYACPKPVDYDWCAVHATPSPVPAPTLKPTPAPDDDDKDDGPTENDVASAGGGAAAAGVVVGLAAGGVLGVLYAKKTNAAPMEQKAYDVSTDRV